MTYPTPPGPQPYQPAGGGYGGPPRPQRLRGRIPLRLALIFGVVGLALVIIGGIVIDKKSLKPVNNFQRVEVTQAGGSVTFDKTGNYLAYYEDKNFDTDSHSIPAPLIVLTSPSGKKKELDTIYGGGSRRGGDKLNHRLTYDYNGHHGIAVYQFKINEKGRYRVDFTAPGGAASGSDIAFGKSIGKGTAIGVALIVPGILLIIAAIVLLIIGLVKRSRHKKQLASGGYGGAPPGYGYSAPGAYPAQQPGGYQPPPGQPGGYQPPPGQPGGYQPPPGQQQPPPETWPPPAASGPSLSKE